MKKVYVVDNQHYISNMFNNNPKYAIVDSAAKADVICWPGGADVNPKYYGQVPIKGTNFTPALDERHKKVWDENVKSEKFFVGICRGGQFLNVMNGGMMWQHVNAHTSNHKLLDLLWDEEVWVTSTHHQMMRVGPEGDVIGIASEATLWMDEKNTISCRDTSDRTKECPPFDTEVVWYKDTKSLCFQPHPEFPQSHQTKNYFFKLMERLL